MSQKIDNCYQFFANEIGRANEGMNKIQNWRKWGDEIKKCLNPAIEKFERCKKCFSKKDNQVFSAQNKNQIEEKKKQEHVI